MIFYKLRITIFQPVFGLEYLWTIFRDTHTLMYCKSADFECGFSMFHILHATVFKKKIK